VRQLTVRNKGGSARDIQEGAGSTVTLDPGGSHGCVVGDEGVTITGSGAVELEAGAEALVLSLVNEKGDVASEQRIEAGSTVSAVGSHTLVVKPEAKAQ
jgi:hypothetical protein